MMGFLQSLDASLLIAVGASFVAGVFGYIIARFWIRPLMRYNVTKRKLDRILADYRGRMNAAASTSPATAASDMEQLRIARQHGMALVACYTNELPYWYRLLLDSRQESPMAAAGLLTNLTKMRDRQQTLQRIDEARQKLNLK